MTPEKLYEAFLATYEGDESLKKMEEVVIENMEDIDLNEEMKEFIINQAAKGHEVGVLACFEQAIKLYLTSLEDEDLTIDKKCYWK